MLSLETQADAKTGHGRRFDLDWLRVIAFVLLIFYHVGQFYNGWDLHVMSVYASLAPENLMRMLNPCRLALSFFISVAAMRFASDKISADAFARSRLKRLGLTILVVGGVGVVHQPSL